MEKTAFAVKIDQGIADNCKTFCKERGIKYSFFIERAIEEKLEEEEMRDDILDLRTLRKEEKLAIPFEKYLRGRSV